MVRRSPGPHQASVRRQRSAPSPLSHQQAELAPESALPRRETALEASVRLAVGPHRAAAKPEAVALSSPVPWPLAESGLVVHRPHNRCIADTAHTEAEHHSHTDDTHSPEGTVGMCTPAAVRRNGGHKAVHSSAWLVGTGPQS